MATPFMIPSTPADKQVISGVVKLGEAAFFGQQFPTKYDSTHKPNQAVIAWAKAASYKMGGAQPRGARWVGDKPRPARNAFRCMVDEEVRNVLTKCPMGMLDVEFEVTMQPTIFQDCHDKWAAMAASAKEKYIRQANGERKVYKEGMTKFLADNPQCAKPKLQEPHTEEEQEAPPREGTTDAPAKKRRTKRLRKAGEAGEEATADEGEGAQGAAKVRKVRAGGARKGKAAAAVAWGKGRKRAPQNDEGEDEEEAEQEAVVARRVGRKRVQKRGRSAPVSYAEEESTESEESEGEEEGEEEESAGEEEHEEGSGGEEQQEEEQEEDGVEQPSTPPAPSITSPRPKAHRRSPTAASSPTNSGTPGASVQEASPPSNRLRSGRQTSPLPLQDISTKQNRGAAAPGSGRRSARLAYR